MIKKNKKLNYSNIIIKHIQISHIWRVLAIQLDWKRASCLEQDTVLALPED